MTAVLLAAALGAVATAATGDGERLSQSGRYRLEYHSRLQPIVINRIHVWELRLTTADGQPVSGARIDVAGGMPSHDHGLPTAPRVSAEPGDGNYLLEGLRFHMNGAWQITFDLQVADQHDRVIVPVEL